MARSPTQRLVPVRLKLGLLLAGTLALAVLAVSAALLRVSREAIEGEVLQRGQVLARQLARVAQEGLLLDDDLLLHSHLAELALEEGVVRAVVVDERGVVRASTALGLAGATAREARRDSGPAEGDPRRGAGEAAGAARGAAGSGGAANRPAAPVRPAGRDGRARAARRQAPPSVGVARHGDLFLISSRVAFQGVRIGEVRLLLAPGPAIERTMARSRRAIAAVALGLLVGGGGFAFFAGRRFVRPIERLADGVSAAATGDLTREVPVTTRDEIGALTRAFNGMLRSLREHEQLRRETEQITDTFRRFVSRDVADELLRHPDARELGGQLREVTVLFADIRNFTALAETMSPRDVVNILNKYFQMMTDAIFIHGGTLDKFMGDCVMAVFGAPVAHPDHASRALWTAIAIQQAVAEENVRRLAWGRYRAVAVGIGIHTGEAVVGNIGTRDRMEYTAIGDCVNTAARLQALARGGQILASGEVFDRAGHEVEAVALPPVRLRGKGEPVPVYSILGPRPARRPGGAARAEAGGGPGQAPGRRDPTPLAGPMVEAVAAIAALARRRG